MLPSISYLFKSPVNNSFFLFTIRPIFVTISLYKIPICEVRIDTKMQCARRHGAERGKHGKSNRNN
mgnify:CR=1 FL=1